MCFLPKIFPIRFACQRHKPSSHLHPISLKNLALASTILCVQVFPGTGAFAQSAAPASNNSADGLATSVEEDALFSSTSSSNLLRGSSDAVVTDARSEPVFNRAVQPEQPIQQGQSSRSADDAYEPLGIKVGSFDLLPSIGFYGEASDNINNSSNRVNGSSGRIEVEVDLRSNWSRHRLAVDGQVAVEGYAEPDRKPEHDANVNAELRIDLKEETSVTLAGGYSYEREAEDNAELRASGLDASNQTILDGRVQLDHDTGLLFAQLRGSLTSESFSNDQSRDNQTIGVGGRFGYHLTDQVSPFVDLAASRKSYENGTNRQNGDNLRASIGIEVANRAKLSGEASVGYVLWKPNASCCSDDGAFFADARLTWSPDPLWTVTAGLDTSLTSSSTRADSLLTHTASLDVDYALRRNLTLSANSSLAREDYRGLGRKDWIANAGLGAEYRVNRNMHLLGRIEHERRDSSFDSEDFRANKIELGVKFLK